MKPFLLLLLACACVLPSFGAPPPPQSSPDYPISLCDWMLLKRQKLGALTLAHELGADGIEIDMGGLGQRETFDNQLVKPEVLAQFLAKSKELKVQFSSLAMSGFYAQSFAEKPGIERILDDTLATAQALGVKVIFLPLGVKGDLIKFPDLRPAIVQRLQLAGKKAEPLGIVIGIETALDAAGEVALLAEIGSPAVKSYFNFANALVAGRDLATELRTLGKDRIAMIP